MADLTCQDFVELVTDYLEGALDEDTVRRFEEHLALCPGCDTYLSQMKETAARLGEIPVESLPAETQSTLLSAFRDFRR
jgi:anti-sigma factor RsiW